MFFIPGIGTFDDLRMAAEYKMPFVRVGTNITEVEIAAPYIELAKKLGFFVAYNGMKSYAVPPAEFAKKSKDRAKLRGGYDLPGGLSRRVLS